MDNLTFGKDAETCITFIGDDRHNCRVWTNDSTTVTKMSKAGFEPNKSDEFGVSYIDVPTNRVFRPRKPVSQRQRQAARENLGKV